MKYLPLLSLCASNLCAQAIPAPKPMEDPSAVTGQWATVADTGVFSMLTISLQERAGGFVGGEWHARLFGCVTLPNCDVAGVVTGERSVASLSLTLHASTPGAFGALYEATLTDSTTALGGLRLMMTERIAGFSWMVLRRRPAP